MDPASDGNVRSRLISGALVVTGCALILASTFLPVMRWSANEHHAVAGDARAWTGDGWTLADAGFGGAWLLPVSTVAAVVLAGLALLWRGSRAWRSQLAVAVVVGYQPLWIAYAFARKLEDDVDPAIGVAVLLLGCASIGAGLWLDRPLLHPAQPLDGPHVRPRQRRRIGDDASRSEIWS